MYSEEICSSRKIGVARIKTMPLGSNKNIVWFIVVWNLSWCLFTVADDYNQVCLVCSSNVSEHCYNYKQAKFSATLIQTIEAQLAIASPRNACKPLTNSQIPNVQRFVLIDGGSCAADVKGHYAHLKGYDAAIIRSMTSDTPQVLEGSGKYDKSLRRDLVISVGKEGGQYLEKHGTSIGCYVKITPQDIYWDFRFYLIPFAVIVGICFILMAMFMISRYYRHHMEQRRSRLSPGNLRKIPTKKFKKGEDFYDLCAICLDEYENGDKLRILPCEHAYHCKCVDPWLTEGKRTCPVCKTSVETDKSSNGHNQNKECDESSANERTPLISPTTRSTRSQSEINV